MLGGILGVIGAVTGLAKKADNSVTAQRLLDGVDNINLAPEERVQYAIDQYKLRADEDENSIRSVIRRVLAVMILGSVFAWIWLAVIFWWVNQEFTNFLFKVLQLDLVKHSALAVVIFYFGYYGFKKGIEAWKGK